MGGILIYIVMFVLSVSLFEVYERIENKKIKIAALIVAILLPCILAGLRDVSIGSDTRGYVSTLFGTASDSASISEYYKSTFYHEDRNYPVAEFDLAYTLLAYFCAHVFRTFGSFLFFSELLVIVPTVAGLMKLKKSYNISLSLSMLIFYFLFYNITFNAARQFLSVAFCFLAICYLLADKNYILTVMFSIIGFCFHRSGLMVLILFMLYLFADVISKDKLKLFKKSNGYLSAIVIMVFALICIFSLKTVAIPILNFLNMNRFTYYILGNITLSFKQLIYQISFIVVLLIEYKKVFLIDKDINTKNARFILFMLFVFVTFCISCHLASIDENSWRIKILFDIFNIVFFSYLFSNEPDKRKKNIILIILITYVLFFWIYTFVVTGRHQTIPYIFGL